MGLGIGSRDLRLLNALREPYSSPLMSGIILQPRSWSRAWARAYMRRREFIKLIAGFMAAWPCAARAQQARTEAVGVLMNR